VGEEDQWVEARQGRAKWLMQGWSCGAVKATGTRGRWCAVEKWRRVQRGHSSPSAHWAGVSCVAQVCHVYPVCTLCSHPSANTSMIVISHQLPRCQAPAGCSQVTQVSAAGPVQFSSPSVLECPLTLVSDYADKPGGGGACWRMQRASCIG
jgi:hypothetical protein